jgi:hypothetical protein
MIIYEEPKERPIVGYEGIVDGVRITLSSNNRDDKGTSLEEAKKRFISGEYTKPIYFGFEKVGYNRMFGGLTVEEAEEIGKALLGMVKYLKS